MDVDVWVRCDLTHAVRRWCLEGIDAIGHGLIVGRLGLIVVWKGKADGRRGK